MAPARACWLRRRRSLQETSPATWWPIRCRRKLPLPVIRRQQQTKVQEQTGTPIAWFGPLLLPPRWPQPPSHRRATRTISSTRLICLRRDKNVVEPSLYQSASLLLSSSSSSLSSVGFERLRRRQSRQPRPGLPLATSGRLQRKRGARTCWLPAAATVAAAAAAAAEMKAPQLDHLFLSTATVTAAAAAAAGRAATFRWLVLTHPEPVAAAAAACACWLRAGPTSAAFTLSLAAHSSFALKQPPPVGSRSELTTRSLARCRLKQGASGRARPFHSSKSVHSSLRVHS